MDGSDEQITLEGMQVPVTRRRCDQHHDAVSSRRRSLLLAVVLLAMATTLDARRTTVCDEPSGLEFDDVASLTVLSSAVFDGRPIEADDDDQDMVEFRVGQFYKGGEMFPEGLQRSSSSASLRVAVRLPSTQCARLLRHRRWRSLVFLNESQPPDSVSDQRPSVFQSTASPVRYSKRSVRTVTQHSCANCGRYLLRDARRLMDIYMYV